MELLRGITLALAVYCLAGLAGFNDAGGNATFDSPIAKAVVFMDDGRRPYFAGAVSTVAVTDYSAVRATRQPARRAHYGFEDPVGMEVSGLVAHSRSSCAVYNGSVRGIECVENEDNTSPVVNASNRVGFSNQYLTGDSGTYGLVPIGAEPDVSSINKPINQRTVTSRLGHGSTLRLTF